MYVTLLLCHYYWNNGRNITTHIRASALFRNSWEVVAKLSEVGKKRNTHQAGLWPSPRSPKDDTSQNHYILQQKALYHSYFFIGRNNGSTDVKRNTKINDISKRIITFYLVTRRSDPSQSIYTSHSKCTDTSNDLKYDDSKQSSHPSLYIQVWLT